MRSVSALVEHLGHEIDFWIITRDRDAGNSAPYPNVSSGKWTAVGKAQVRYLKPRELSVYSLVAATASAQPHIVYLNGLFGPMAWKLLLARRLGALKKPSILLAPRGELSPGALALKSFKKRCFLQFARWAGLHSNVMFHASTHAESTDIASVIEPLHSPLVARNLINNMRGPKPVRSKVGGAARFVFVSRIDRKKNLHVAIDLLRDLSGAVEFHIYGPVTDKPYWKYCQGLIEQTPAGVSVIYHGPIPHELVASVLAAHHFFLFPSAGENFGHAIVEAFLAGCPVITSDRTPWRGLRPQAAGWDLALDDTGAWRRVLQECVDADPDTYARLSLGSAVYGARIAAADVAAETRGLFESVLNRSRPRPQIPRSKSA